VIHPCVENLPLARRIHFIRTPGCRREFSTGLLRLPKKLVPSARCLYVFSVFNGLPRSDDNSVDAFEPASLSGDAVLVFVYGTLQRGRALHHHLAGQLFVGAAKTQHLYRLYRIDWYPGIVEHRSSGQGLAIHGEVWDVDEPVLKVLDEVEEVDSGLYERRLIRLQEPFEQSDVVAYFYLGDVEDCLDNGDRW
jgi:gamma-glutamylcyclotransferase (GGCT)/AIG2-like uncharacterized protein YtfP